MKKVLNLHKLTIIKIKASLEKKNDMNKGNNNNKMTIFTSNELFDLYKKCSL